LCYALQEIRQQLNASIATRSWMDAEAKGQAVHFFLDDFLKF